MSRRRDFQIWWIVLAAGFFWVVIWQHDIVSKWSHTAFNAAAAVTSGLRSPAPPTPDPVEAPGTTKRTSGKVAPKHSDPGVTKD